MLLVPKSLTMYPGAPASSAGSISTTRVSTPDDGRPGGEHRQQQQRPQPEPLRAGVGPGARTVAGGAGG